VRKTENQREGIEEDEKGQRGQTIPPFILSLWLAVGEEIKGKDLCHRPDHKKRRTQKRNDLWTL